jgi:hypothetical protein
MRSAYRTLCYLVAFDVMLQAAFIAWAVFGLGKWVDDGGVLDKSVKNDTSTFHFTEERGFMFHGINGQMVIPLLVIVLLVVAFRAKVPGGVAWAAVLVGLVAIQAFLLPVLGEDFPAFGAVHGLNALLIFGTALLAGRRVDTTVAEPAAV